MRYKNDLRLGVLGGGQLGRMLIQKAIDFNIQTIILDPDVNAPCKNIASEFHVGSLNDFDTVVQFGSRVDLVTIEIENVNCDALKALQEKGIPVFPQPEVIELIQDKGLQKEFYQQHDIPTASFELIDSKGELMEQLDFFPAVQKLRKAGYDGRGVQVINDAADIDKAFEQPSVLESFVDYEKELSVIVARNESGETKAFPLVELQFHPTANLVEYLFSPADVNTEIEQRAREVAIKVAEALDIIGLLAVELFLTRDGKILVNEVAPRTHNSGHQSIEGNVVSQFEQHLRAILNMPLGATDIKVPSVMVNLLGAEGYEGEAKYDGMQKVLSLPGVAVHLYGKKLTRPFRKMGHVTITDPNLELAKERATFVKEHLKVIA